MMSTSARSDSEPTAHLSTSELVAGIAQGAPEMEDAFCRRYYPSVLRILRSYTQDTCRAEDMTQDVLLTVLLRLRKDGIDHPDRLTSFVHQTARFTFIGWTRQSDAKLVLCESMDDTSSVHRVEDACLALQQQTMIIDLLQSMTVKRDREVLRRSYLGEEDKRVICKSLNLTDTHFDRVISRARLRLRQLVLGQQEEVRQLLQEEIG